ncbi:MAG: DUF2064 domain-containing protein, partial [Salibacteraceae bacterium]
MFSRTGEAEARAKSFLGRAQAGKSQQIAKQLVARSHALAAASGLPAFVIDSTHQSGNSFGERISHAIQEVFNQGYDQLLVIGNDCPELHVERLHQAA